MLKNKIIAPEIHDVLDMIKNVTEILEQHQVLLDKIKGRLGICLY